MDLTRKEFLLLGRTVRAQGKHEIFSASDDDMETTRAMVYRHLLWATGPYHYKATNQGALAFYAHMNDADHMLVTWLKMTKSAITLNILDELCERGILVRVNKSDPPAFRLASAASRAHKDMTYNLVIERRKP